MIEHKATFNPENIIQNMDSTQLSPVFALSRVPLLSTFSGLMLEGHRRVDLSCVHAHPAAWVRQGRALRLPVVVSRGHVAARWPAVHPVLVGGRVGARRDVTGQRGGGLQADT